MASRAVTTVQASNCQSDAPQRAGSHVSGVRGQPDVRQEIQRRADNGDAKQRHRARNDGPGVRALVGADYRRSVSLVSRNALLAEYASNAVGLRSDVKVIASPQSLRNVNVAVVTAGMLKVAAGGIAQTGLEIVVWRRAAVDRQPCAI